MIEVKEMTVRDIWRVVAGAMLGILLGFLLLAEPREVRAATETLPIVGGPAAELPQRSMSGVVTRAPVSAPRVLPEPAAVYRVARGDTLSHLAKRFCTTVETIVRENRISNPDLIFVGQSLTIAARGMACGISPGTVKQSVSPERFVHSGGVSREKQSVVIPQSREVDPTAPLAEIHHQRIYRIAALRSRPWHELSATERGEYQRLTAIIRRDVLARYPLVDAECLYRPDQGQTAETQMLARIACIRTNFGPTIAETARANGLEPSFLEAVIIAESNGRPDAISSTGCTGLKQFTIGSAKQYGLRDRLDPFESIRKGGEHLRSNLREWRGDIVKATAAYNLGPAAVRAPGFDAQAFGYVRNILRIKRLIDERQPFPPGLAGR
jgi:LysM repeat protein